MINQLTKRIILISISVLISTVGWSQIKIGDNPTMIDPNAVLEMESTDKGMLLPRLGLTSTTSASPLTAHSAGMTVYNTATAGTAPTNVTPGFYINDGTKWMRIAASDSAITQKNTTASSLITITNGTGATFTAMVVGVDTTALKTFLNNKIKVSTTAPITGDGTSGNPIGVTRANTTAASSLITISNGTNATFTAMTIDIDTNQLKTFLTNSLTADNGITKTGLNFQLGGDLTKATTIGTSATNTLKVTGLGTGASRDSVLVLDSATGVMKKISASSLLAGATTDTLNSAGNIMTSKVNGVSDTAKIINSLSTVKTGLKVVTTVNGVADSFTLPSDSTKANNGISKSGDTVQLGGALTKATTLTTTATNTLAVAGLQSGSTTDSVMVTDPTTGVVKRVSASTLLNNLKANNGVTKSGDTIQLGGNLTKATTIGTSATNTLKVTGLGTGASRDSILVLDSATGVMKKISASSLLAGATTDTLNSTGNIMTSKVNGVSDTAKIINSLSTVKTGLKVVTTVNGVADSFTLPSDSTKANNGISKSGDTVQLGGALTKATTVTTTATNTLAVAGLTSGTATDSIMVTDPTTGVVKRVSASTLLNNLKANNGVTKSGDTVQLGGNLTKATTIGTSATNSLKVTGLGTGASRDSVLVLDSATGVMKKISASSLLAGATTDTLNSAGNIMTSKVNGVSDTAKIINSLSTVKTGLKVVTTVNGVADSFTLPSDSTKANNGISKSGDTVQLGGALTKATTLTTTATNTLAVAGLTSGTATDSIMVTDPTTGVVKRVSASTLLNNLKANNGVTKSGDTIQLGGALTKATDIATTSTNTLKISGLQNGSVKDSVLVLDSATGVMKKISTSSLLAGATTDTLNSAGNIMTSKVNGISDTAKIINSLTTVKTGLKVVTTVNGIKDSFTLPSDSTRANNGLSKSGDTVQLGGALTKATTVTTSATNTLTLAGLQKGKATDSIIVADSATGVLKKVAANTLLNGATTNVITFNGNTLTSTVNGVTDTAVLSNADSTTADNGLEMNGKTVYLGGTLLQATKIITSATNTLAIGNLQSGSVSDSVIVNDPLTGVLKRISSSSLLAGATTDTLSSSGNIMTSKVNGVSDTSKIINSNVISLVGDTLTTTVNGVVSNKIGINAVEPWNSTVTNTGAKSNTDSVYIMGKVGINTSTPNSYLQVKGSVATPARKVTAATTVTIDDYTVLANLAGGGFMVTLPAASTCDGRIYQVGKTDASSNVLTFSQSIRLTEAVTFTTTNFKNMWTIQSIGGQWWVIGQ